MYILLITPVVFAGFHLISEAIREKHTGKNHIQPMRVLYTKNKYKLAQLALISSTCTTYFVCSSGLWLDLIGRTVPYSGEERCYDECQNSPEMGEDLADVVATGAQDSEDRISSNALEGAACQSTVSFHVSDLGLNGAAPSEIPYWGSARITAVVN